MEPRLSLNRWLKDHPHASQAHRVRYYDAEMLVCYCGHTIPAAVAVAASQTVACCPSCTVGWRKQVEAKKRKR